MGRRRVGVIGMGASGCMAAWHAARQGAEVFLFDRNEKIGKKIYITGKGRCNVTNRTAFPSFFEGIAQGRRFLYSALHFWTPEDTIRFFEEHGIALKVERGQRVFPVTDHASDINRALQHALEKEGVHLFYSHCIEKVQPCEQGFSLFTVGRVWHVDHLILATGGCSYPLTGSTGDGYDWAKQLGHTIHPPVPSLVAMRVSDPQLHACQGLSLRNVALTVKGKKKKVYTGELLITHEGISGPVVLRASADFAGQDHLKLSLNWKPALDRETLQHRLQNERKQGKRHVLRILEEWLPRKAVELFIARFDLHVHQPIHQWKKEEQNRFLEGIQNFELPFSGFGSFREAVVTRGGVKTKEVDPKTMRSKCCSHLSICGELLDVDGYTGGYNLQIAFSTGAVAGFYAGEDDEKELIDRH